MLTFQFMKIDLWVMERRLLVKNSPKTARLPWESHMTPAGEWLLFTRHPDHPWHFNSQLKFALRSAVLHPFSVISRRPMGVCRETQQRPEENGCSLLWKILGNFSEKKNRVRAVISRSPTNCRADTRGSPLDHPRVT